MIEVCVLGAGKVGHHIINECLINPNIKLVQIYNRSLSTIQQYKKQTLITNNCSNIVNAPLYIVCLPDDVIKQLDLFSLKGLVVHTSGTKSYQEIRAGKRGVLYPLQSFSVEKQIDFKKVPFCIETEKKEDLVVLTKFAQYLSNKTQIINQSQREKIHLAAVFANNFSNRMLGIAYDLCKEHQIDFSLLQPLIQETFDKITKLPPHQAQTGPAIRNDEQTLKKHLTQLSGTEKEIYKLVTKSIQDKNGKKL